MQYYILVNGKKIGPVEKEHLPAYGLTRNSQVWTEGMPQWQPAWQVPDLQSILATLPPSTNDDSSSMNFGKAIKVCFSKYVDFSGRARRSEYWWWQLFCLLLCSISCFVGALVVLLPSIAVTVRRLHDTGKSGWYYLLGLVPIVGGLILLIFMLQDSDDDNEYGPDPKGDIYC